MLFFGVYLLLSSQSFEEEEKKLKAFLNEISSQEWILDAYKTAGVFYHTTSCLALLPLKKWKEVRLQILKRILISANAHYGAPKMENVIYENFHAEPLNYEVYKPYLMFWTLIDLSYSFFDRTEITTKEEDWPLTVSLGSF